MRRRDFLGVVGGAAASVPIAGRAQQPERMRRIGVLMAFGQADAGWQRAIAAFQEGLKRLGWAQGHNLQIEYRWGESDSNRLQRYAAELVGLNLDVLIGQTTPSVAALQRTTYTIPIVFVNVSDPIGSGFVNSLPHPGGNITGFSNFESSMGSKWVEFLKEIAPQVKRIALLSNPETSPQAKSYLPSAERAALSLGLQLIASPVYSTAEIEHAIDAIGRDPGGGLVLPADVFTFSNRELIIRLANQYRLAAVYPFGEFTQSGGLLSYGVDLVSQFGQAASYVDHIFKGERAGELPVQTPTKFELTINLKTAKALGLDVPPTLLASADEVIE
jgi:putative tryptophan/tyrosine transport system substrate-binding protein